MATLLRPPPPPTPSERTSWKECIFLVAMENAGRRGEKLCKREGRSGGRPGEGVTPAAGMELVRGGGENPAKPNDPALQKQKQPE